MLTLNRLLINLRTILIIAIAIPFINACDSTGGECRYHDNERLGKVVGTKDDSTMIIDILQSQGESRFYIAKSKFSKPPKKGDLLDVTIRHHISGGCAPVSIVQIKERPHLNEIFAVTPKHAYQAAFKLSEAQACAYQQTQQPLLLNPESTSVAIEDIAACVSHVSFINALSESQKKQILRINVKTFEQCSLATITMLRQGTINNFDTETSMIGCASYEKIKDTVTEKYNKAHYQSVDLQTPIEYSFETNSENQITVRFINIY